MRNYIILNNKKSDTISGLIIQELPPISKPAQRTQIETIDGRDGDIVTPLGYAAYDKTFTIGLYGTFDINEIIAYFATQGQVIFSNEPNKYYNYQIVDQIDYERLVRYRVATVTMHVQPFKYSSTETPIIVDSSDTVSGEGSNIALANTAEAPFNTLRHKGNATQQTYSGKNLLNVNFTSQQSYSGLQITNNGDGTITVSGTTTGINGFNISPASTSVSTPLILLANTTYTQRVEVISGSMSNISVVPAFKDSGGTINYNYFRDNQTKTTSGTMTCHAYNLYWASANLSINCTLRIWLEPGSDLSSTFEPYVGSTPSQITPSPNPDYPQNVQVLTGESTVKIEGKNLLNANRTLGTPSDTNWANSTKRTFNFDDYIVGITRNNYYSGATVTTVTLTDGAFTVTTMQGGYGLGLPIKLSPNTTYTLSFNATNATNVEACVGFYQSDGTYIDNIAPIRGKTTLTFTTPNNCAFVDIILTNATGQTCTYSNIQLELGSSASQFEPHKEQSYVLPFGDTYLAAIGDYADEPVKVDGTWYIRRAVGKAILTGSEAGWSLANVTTGFTRAGLAGLTSPEQAGMCDNFTPRTGAHGAYEYIWFRAASIGGGCFIQINTTRLSDDTLDAFKTWLSTHNTTVYYALATPTDEAITDQDLIDALDELYDQAHSYKGHTHITATAADGNAPAVLSVEVGEDNESTVTNAGNTTSRPIITIYGQGDIGVYINDVEVLDVALGDEGYITLDSVEMEAYKDTTANLKNRLVTGDYSKLALNAGANKIRFTGKVTKYEISKYSRWL